RDEGMRRLLLQACMAALSLSEVYQFQREEAQEILKRRGAKAVRFARHPGRPSVRFGQRRHGYCLLAVKFKFFTLTLSSILVFPPCLSGGFLCLVRSGESVDGAM